MFGRKKQAEKPPAVAVQTVPRDCRPGLFAAYPKAQSAAERRLYASLRASVPMIDAAIGKIIRLIGKFRIIADDPSAQAAADDFVRGVRVNGSSMGLAAFVNEYLDSLLTYGEAIGEMLLDENQTGVCALYNASLDDVGITSGESPMELIVYRRDAGENRPVENRSLVLASLLRQKSGTVRGTPLLEGLPFVSEILMRIFAAVKTNWERVGDMRFAVTYDPKDGSFSEENAHRIADEWKQAMRSDRVCDFVASGDVSVKVIGSEAQMPDCEVPVRVMLEQLVAKLGIPPFLLGISWSSTERMSAQQADILTSELEYYRAAVEPVIRRVLTTHLRLAGLHGGFDIEWNDINLQDAVELSQARLNNARALQIEKEYGLEGNDDF